MRGKTPHWILFKLIGGYFIESWMSWLVFVANFLQIWRGLASKKNRKRCLKSLFFENVVSWAIFCSFESSLELIILSCIFLFHFDCRFDHFVVVCINIFQKFDSFGLNLSLIGASSLSMLFFRNMGWMRMLQNIYFLPLGFFCDLFFLDCCTVLPTVWFSTRQIKCRLALAMRLFSLYNFLQVFVADLSFDLC